MGGFNSVVFDGIAPFDLIPDPDDTYWLGSDTLGWKGIKFPDLKLYQLDANTLSLENIAGGTYKKLQLGEVVLGDDAPITFGGVAKLLWETADANANALILALPDGGATDVSVFVIGDQSILNVDLGWFNNVAMPRLAIIDADADCWASVGFLADDRPALMALAGRYWTVGTQAGVATGHALASPDDVLIQGKLEIDGIVYFDNDIFTDRWLLQDSNTFVGVGVVGAGNLAHTVGTTGYYNAFLGYYAGRNNITGENNTFLGSQAGYSNTTGYDNVFLGRQSGYYENGHDKLFIASSATVRPLIYGEFDNLLLRLNSMVADAGNTLRNSPTLTWRGAYWNGAASVDRDFTIQQIIDATTPKSTVNLALAGVSVLQMLNDNGKVMMLAPTENAKPAAAAAYRNALLVQQGAAGVTDTVYMCLKAAADTYSWVSIATGG